MTTSSRRRRRSVSRPQCLRRPRRRSPSRSRNTSSGRGSGPGPSPAVSHRGLGPCGSAGLNPDRSLQVPRAVESGRVVRGQSRARRAGVGGDCRSRRLHVGPGGLLPCPRARARRPDLDPPRRPQRCPLPRPRVERWPKDRFPTRRAYRPTRSAALRLITCGGSFNDATGHYLDNTVVFARRAPARQMDPPSDRQRR